MTAPIEAVALGEEPADLLIRGGEVLLPDGTFEPRAVAVVGDRIAGTFEADDAERVVGESTTVVDATGQTVVPGFVDAHTHLDFNQALEYSAPDLLATGTTAVITELTAFGAYGAPGIEEYLAATEGLPVTAFAALLPRPFVDTFDDMWLDGDDLDSLSALLDHERVSGVGELDWIHVVGRDDPVDALFAAARDADKPVTTHGAGVGGDDLRALATIADNDHEPISPEGVRARVREGMHVVSRAGSIRDDVPALATAHAEGVDTLDCSLSTDGAWPRDLLESGAMDRVVRLAIDSGVPPADAFRMASESPARHFRLGKRGVVAPGAVADLVCLADREAVDVDTVVADGEVVVRDGDPLVEPRPYDYDEKYRDTLDLRPSAETFRVDTDSTPGDSVRAIESAEGLLTRETTVDPPVEGGEFRADPAEGLLKVGMFDCRPGVSRREPFTGFLTGYALERGALATSTTWEVPSVVVVGSDEAEMAAAVGHLTDLGGGWAVVEDGDVVADHPCPVVASTAPMPTREAASNLADVEAALRERGVRADHPLVGVGTLTFPGVPALKLAFGGYADVLGRAVVGLDPEE